MLTYITGGDLWVKELPEGQAQPLTADGRATRPCWSPSGQWLAYLKDGELWVVRSGGGDARALGLRAQVHTFVWSPVADTLAYTTRAGDLRMASASVWHEQELVTGPSGREGWGVRSLAWSPNGEWLAYVREQVVKEGVPPDRYAGLWRININGGGATELFNSGMPAHAGLIVAGWFPDGQHILFWPVSVFSSSALADSTSLMAIPATGGQPVELVPSLLAREDFLAWSPDGKLLAVTAGGGRETWSHKHIALLEPSSGKLTQLTEGGTAAFSPAWSPDGQYIAYVAAPDIGLVGGGEEAKAGAAKRRIWVMNKDGSDKRQLTHDAAYRDERPLWSADGSHILFARLDQSGRASLWLMCRDGSGLHQVVEKLGTAPWSWFGYYGYIRWDDYFEWWIGAPGGHNRSPPGNCASL